MYLNQIDNVRLTENCGDFGSHSCRRNATILSLCIIVDINVAVNNIKLFSIVTETQQWLPLASLSSYKMSSNAVNNTKTLRSSSEVPDIVVHF